MQQTSPSNFTGRNFVTCSFLTRSLALGTGSPLDHSGTFSGDHLPRTHSYFLVGKGQNRSQTAKLFPVSRALYVMCGTHCNRKVRGPLFKNVWEFPDGDSTSNPGQGRPGVGPAWLRRSLTHRTGPDRILLPAARGSSSLAALTSTESRDQPFLFVIASSVLPMPGF